MSTSTPLVVTLTAAQGKKLLAALPDAPEGLTYVCIGANCWGAASKATAAAKRARDEGVAGDYIIHLVNEDFEISSIDGTLYYDAKMSGVQAGIARFKQR